jgi:hypothetical protein
MVRSVLTYLAAIAGMVAFSALFILLFANSIEVQCVREAGAEPACRITRQLLGRFPQSDRDVLGVIDVQMEENCDEDGCHYRAELITSTGQSVPLNDVYTDRGIALRQVDAFEGFLGGIDESFEYVEPVAWWVVIMILAMDMMGVVFMAAHFLRSARAGQA